MTKLILDCAPFLPWLLYLHVPRAAWPKSLKALLLCFKKTLWTANLCDLEHHLQCLLLFVSTNFAHGLHLFALVFICSTTIQQLLFQTFSFDRNLNLTDMKQLTDDLLERLAPTLPPKLQELTLRLARCEQVTDIGVKRICAFIPKALTFLIFSLHGCQITDVALAEIARALPFSMKRLRLSFGLCNSHNQYWTSKAGHATESDVSDIGFWWLPSTWRWWPRCNHQNLAHKLRDFKSESHGLSWRG